MRCPASNSSRRVLVIMYFTCIHSTLVMFGMFGLAKAMAGQAWRFPLIGPALK